MKIDVLLDPFGVSWGQLLDVAEAVEGAGFDGVWTWDHLAGQVHGEAGVLECWTVLSALAARTRRVTVGPLVLNVANRRPGVLAVAAATLQQVSGGRLILGLGAGGGRATPYAGEQRALGGDVAGDAARRRQVADAVAVCRQVWTGHTEPGELGSVRLGAGSGFLRPEPPPPIVVGGFGPKTAALAGQVADGFNTQAGHPELERLIDVARQAHREAGREGPFEISGFAGLDPRWVERSRGRIDRLIVLASPADGPAAVTAFARSAGLS
ncbi:MAG: LLM class flavin-dependent oxidoreductase [Acidimicrobiales bacterium]